jgi:hypothetical protein
MELRFLIRFASLTYVGVLSVLLLTPMDSVASASLYWPNSALALLVPGVHFFAILLLGLLIFAARWPLPLWSAVSILAVYAVGTEGLQSFIPSRTPEFRDLVQNLGGLGVATAFWLACQSIRRLGGSRARAAIDLRPEEDNHPLEVDPRGCEWMEKHEATEETCPTGC